MKINQAEISLSVLKALLGAVTENLRGVSVSYSSKHIYLFFYYQNSPTEEEEELAEVVGTEVVSDFPDIALQEFKVNKIVYPYPEKLPDEGIRIFHRYEPTPIK